MRRSDLAAAALVAAALYRRGGRRIGPVSHDPGSPGEPPKLPVRPYPSSRNWGPTEAKKYLIQTHASAMSGVYIANPNLQPSSSEDAAAVFRLLGQRFDIPPGVLARTVRLESGSNLRMIAGIPLTTSAWGIGQMIKSSAEYVGVDWLDNWWWPTGAWCVAELYRKFGWHSHGPEHAIARYRGGSDATKAARIADVLPYMNTDPAAIIKWVPHNRFAYWYGGERYDPWWKAPELAPWREGWATSVGG